MSWKIEYLSHQIEGMNGCDACCVTLSARGFEWDIFCVSVHSAKIQIRKHINRERMAEVEAMYKEQQK